jgi:arylformamidase
MKLIDVTVPLDTTLATYPNNTPFSLEGIKRISRGDTANLSTVHMSAHSGTHVDAPLHFFDDRPGTEALSLDLLIGPAQVIELSGGDAVTADDLSNVDLAGSIRLLIKTRNSNLWSSSEFHTDYVGVSESGAKYLVERGIRVVGVDYLSVERFRWPGAPAHHVLLGAGVVVIEGLDLRDVEPGVYDMYCLPLRIVGSDGAPARVVLARN